MKKELFVITCYFNPNRYRTRRWNYDIFVAGLRNAGIPFLVVECAFGNDDFELPKGDEVVQVRSDTLLWQKERLLNLAVSWLPPECRYVAWLDCDITFESRTWYQDTIELLKKYKIVQVWDKCIRLNASHNLTTDQSFSFAHVMNITDKYLECDRYDLHGHTGYGWAIRRDIIEQVGFYESAISGSSDHFMAHAIYGKYGFCVENALKHDKRQIAHLKEWGTRFYNLVRGSLGVVPGTIHHYWHGDLVNRKYFLRMHEITDLGFNPWTDIQSKEGHPLSWTEVGLQKTGLVQYFYDYFSSRKEDGI